MFRFLKSKPRWMQAGWLLPLVLLALPNCILPAYEWVGEAFDPGENPTSAIMCDIPKPPPPDFVECASEVEEGEFPSMSHAAILLSETEGGSIALDYSKDSLLKCFGQPRKVQFRANFPDGNQICLNCGQIGALPPAKFIDGNAACVAKCIDLVHEGGNEPAEGAESFCQSARLSTNFAKNKCYDGVCSSSGMPNNFADPRRFPEPIVWTDFKGAAQIGTEQDGDGLSNTLMKINGVDATNFDSGAASEQTIAHGDAFVEFEASEINKSHVVGVMTDEGPGAFLDLELLPFVLSLNYDEGFVYVVEKGVAIQMPELSTQWVAQYLPKDRFRLEITDNHDGTAKISYSKLDGSCPWGTKCLVTPLATSQGSLPYPIRIVGMFRQNGAMLNNVTVVRIQHELQ